MRLLGLLLVSGVMINENEVSEENENEEERTEETGCEGPDANELCSCGREAKLVDNRREEERQS